MKINVQHIWILSLAVCISVGAFIKSAEAIDDAILAVVNDEILTVRDLKEYIQSAYMNLMAKGADEEIVKGAMLEMEINGLNRLIEDKLILSRANTIDLQVRDKLIDERMNEIKSKYDSEEEFLAALSQSGSSVTDIRTKIEDQLKIQFVVNHEVKSKIFVNPQEVTRYYQDHLADFQKKERIVLDSIFIQFKKDRAVAEAKAKDAIAKINEGVDFIEVAKQFSSTPPLGIVERGQLMPTVEKVVFDLEINEVTPPIEVDTGIFIFKLNEKIQAKTAPIEEVKENIYNAIFNQKFKKKFEKWIGELKKDAYIEIKK